MLIRPTDRPPPPGQGSKDSLQRQPVGAQLRSKLGALKMRPANVLHMLLIQQPIRPPLANDSSEVRRGHVC